MLNSLSSDPSQTDRRSRRTSKIGGAQLQYILSHFRLVSASEPQNPRTSSLHKNIAHPLPGRTDRRTKVEISKNTQNTLKTP